MQQIQQELHQQTPSHNALDEISMVAAAAQWSAGEAPFSPVAPRVPMWELHD